MAFPTSKIPSSTSYRQQPNLAWITTKAFNTELYSYSTYQNAQYQTVGTLTANSSANLTNCPAGRILHANGKQLLPGVNPNVTKPYIGVYDTATGLNGYIDPTSNTFAKYDVTLPASYDLGGATDPNGGVSSQGAPLLGGLGAKLNLGSLSAVSICGFLATVPNASRTLTVTKVLYGTVSAGMAIYSDSSLISLQTISAYGSNSTTGTGSTGTYYLSANSDAAASTEVFVIGFNTFTASTTSGSTALTAVAVTAGTLKTGMYVYNSTATTTTNLTITYTSGATTATLSGNAAAGAPTVYTYIAFDLGQSATPISTAIGQLAVTGTGTAVTVYNSNVRPNSIILISMCSGSSSSPILIGVTNQADGVFTVTFTAGTNGLQNVGIFNYIVIN